MSKVAHGGHSGQFQIKNINFLTYLDVQAI